MAEAFFLAAVLLFGVSLVLLVVSALVSDERRWRMPVRLTGMFMCASAFMLTGAAFTVAALFAGKILPGDVLFSALAVYFAVDTVIKARRELQAYRGK